MPLTFKIGNLYEEICPEPHDTQSDALVVPRIPFDKDYMGIAKKMPQDIVDKIKARYYYCKGECTPRASGNISRKSIYSRYECPTVTLTAGYNNVADYPNRDLLIHIPVCNFYRGDDADMDLNLYKLEREYISVLDCARKNEIEKIIFPLLGVDEEIAENNRWTYECAAFVADYSVRKWLTVNSDSNINVVIYTPKDIDGIIYLQDNDTTEQTQDETECVETSYSKDSSTTEQTQDETEYIETSLNQIVQSKDVITKPLCIIKSTIEYDQYIKDGGKKEKYNSYVLKELVNKWNKLSEKRYSDNKLVNIIGFTHVGDFINCVLGEVEYHNPCEQYSLSMAVIMQFSVFDRFKFMHALGYNDYPDKKWHYDLENMLVESVISKNFRNGQPSLTMKELLEKNTEVDEELFRNIDMELYNNDNENYLTKPKKQNTKKNTKTKEKCQEI